MVIINHKLKYIFIAIPKTASTSIRHIFNPNPGEADPPPEIYHMSLEKVLKQNPGCEQYFKFAYVRNPWDRFVSLYHHFKQNKSHAQYFNKYPTFKHFVLNFRDDEDITNLIHAKAQVDFISIDGELAVDFYGRFESLETDLHSVAQKVNVTITNIPHIRNSSHEHYRNLYDDELKKIVESFYAKDIATFKYQF